MSNGRRDGGGGRRTTPDPMALLGAKVPPQNIESEMGVLGSILLDHEVLNEIRAVLAAEDFYRDSHAETYRVICAMADEGVPADALTLADRLARLGLFKPFGGENFLADLINSVPHAANGLYYAQIVRQ